MWRTHSCVRLPYSRRHKILLAHNLDISYTERAGVMRAVIASALILFFVSVVVLCPAIACPVAAPSCCHKPAKAAPDCPYSILEKSKTNPAATHTTWLNAIVQTDHSATLPVAGPAPTTPCRLIDTAGLFLRNRVLLI